MKLIHSKDTLPTLRPHDYIMDYMQSDKVLGYNKHGCVSVVEYWLEDDNEGYWHSCCSQGWNLGDEIVAWCYLPKFTLDEINIDTK